MAEVTLRRAASAAFLALTTHAAIAAGGHHAVDDANIAGAGECKIETWLTNESGGHLLHAGTGCGTGPLELVGAVEHARGGGASDTGWLLQAKWAAALTGPFRTGLSVTAGWQSHVRPRFQGTSAIGLFTWAASDRLSVHLNLGREFNRSSPDANRYGAALEWFPAAGWSFVAERYNESATQFARAGARRSFTDSIIVDVSRAQRLSGPAASSWTAGATWLF